MPPATGYQRVGLWLIIIALAGLVTTSLSGLGSYKSFVNTAALLVLVHAIHAFWQGARPDRRVGWLLLVPIVFIVCDTLASGGFRDSYALRNIIAFVVVAGAVWLLPALWPEPAGRRCYLAMVLVLAIIAAAHAVLLWLYLEPAGPMSNPRLLFHNPHFIALQATVGGVVMCHAWAGGGVSRWIALLGLASVLVSIVLLKSAVGTVSLAAAAAVVWVAHLPRTLRVAALWLGGLLGVAVLIYPLVADRLAVPLEWIMVEAGASRPDERFELWGEAWELQRESNSIEWLIGHGLRGFADKYWDIWDFAHHFPLEVLYNSGIVGLGAFGLAVGALVVSMFRRVRPGERTVLLAAALIAAVGVFTFLTLPLTSRVGAHALGLCIGLWLWATKGSSAVNTRSG